MNNYVVLLSGTPFMDGKYSSMHDAYSAQEHIRSVYPKQRLDIIQVLDSFDVTNDIFWSDNQDELDYLWGKKNLVTWRVAH